MIRDPSRVMSMAGCRRTSTSFPSGLSRLNRTTGGDGGADLHGLQSPTIAARKSTPEISQGMVVFNVSAGTPAALAPETAEDGGMVRARVTRETICLLDSRLNRRNSFEISAAD